MYYYSYAIMCDIIYYTHLCNIIYIMLYYILCVYIIYYIILSISCYNDSASGAADGLPPRSLPPG